MSIGVAASRFAGQLHQGQRSAGAPCRRAWARDHPRPALVRPLHCPRADGPRRGRDSILRRAALPARSL